MKKQKNAILKPELFRLSNDVWDSLTYEEIVETAMAMDEVGIYKPPFRNFDVECDTRVFYTFGRGSEYPDENMSIDIDKLVCHYRLDSLTKNPDQYHLTSYKDAYKREIHPWSVTPDAQDAFHDFFLFVYAALIVVLASKNIDKKQVVNDPRARNHTQRTDSKNYASTTTIRIGKITEYIGNKAEGSGRTVRAHLRRGHVKGVRYGEGKTEIKKVFIQPTFVNADRDWVAPKRESYKVKLDGKAVRL